MAPKDVYEKFCAHRPEFALHGTEMAPKDVYEKFCAHRPEFALHGKKTLQLDLELCGVGGQIAFFRFMLVVSTSTIPLSLFK